MKFVHLISSFIPPLIFVLYFSDIYITQDAVMTHDSIMSYGSFNYFLLTLAGGDFPLWDPFSFSGTAFFPNYNTNVLDPIVLLMVPLVRFFDFSALSLFHFHHLLQLFVYYWGVYFLCVYVSKKTFPALLSSSFVLFVVGTNSLRQNGSLIGFYMPWIFLFLLLFFSRSISRKNRRLCFIAFCYFVGLSINLFIPSYLFIFICLLAIYAFTQQQCRLFGKNSRLDRASFYFNVAIRSGFFVFALFFLGYLALEGSEWVKLTVIPLASVSTVIWFFKSPYISHLSRSIGWRAWLIGVGLFIALSSPFMFSLTQVLPEQSENFGYLRAVTSQNSTEFAHLNSNELLRPEWHFNLNSHYLIRFLTPFTDIRYFLGTNFLWEINIFFGIAPLIVCFLFYKRARSPYKPLFLFLFLSFFLLMFCPKDIYENSLQYFPGYSTIRVLLGFSGYFFAVYAGLLSICLVEFGKAFTCKNNEPGPSMIWLAALAMAHVLIIFSYLNGNVSSTEEGLPLHLEWFEENLNSHLWILWGAYLALAIFLKTRSKVVRILSCGYLGALTLFQAADFMIKYRVFVLQPAYYAQAPSIHKAREFQYREIRVPAVIRLGPLWLYRAAMYRIPSAGSIPPTSYHIVGRRAYDMIRWFNIENFKISAGIGGKRYGFFDHYILANDSKEALRLAGGLSADILKRSVVLEEEPEYAPGLNEVSLASNEDIALKLSKYPNSKIMELYDINASISLSGFIPSNGAQELRFDDSKEGLDFNWPWNKEGLDFNWPWNMEHMGFFQFINNFKVISNLSSVFFHNYLYSAGIGFPENESLCLTKKYVHAALPYEGEPRSIANGAGFCDLYLSEGNLMISKLHWREEMAKKSSRGQQGSALESDLLFLSLSRDKTTPEKSPYARDEPTEVLDFGPNHIRFKIDNGKAGLFYYADSYSKHWKAWVDGKSTEVLRANFNFKAVYLDKGEHIVEFRYEPDLFIFFMKAFIPVSILGMAICFWAFYINFLRNNQAGKATRLVS